MTIKPLSWDSGFFGVSVGELSFVELTSDIEDQIKDPSNPDLLYLRYRGADQKDLARLARTSACWVNQVTFERSLVALIGTEPNDAIVETSVLSESLASLAISAGKYSRFNHDSRLKTFFNSLYLEWIRNSLSGIIADKVFVYRKEVLDCGLITLSVKESHCAVVGLLSVSPQMQGKGIATALLNVAEKWAVLNGADRMRIATQSNNESAVRFYNKAGYSIRDSEYIFHLWKEDWKDEYAI